MIRGKVDHGFPSRDNGRYGAPDSAGGRGFRKDGSCGGLKFGDIIAYLDAHQVIIHRLVGIEAKGRIAETPAAGGCLSRLGLF